MRNYFAIIALSSIVLLTWCGQQQEYITVQWFSFLANTIISSDINENVASYVIANTKTMSWDLLTVLYQPIDSNADTGARAASNIHTLQQTYPSIGIIEQSETTFTCNDEDIYWTLVLGTLPTDPEKDPLYFAQHFFIHKWIWYVFTYSSSHEKTTTSMGDDWQRTRCEPA